MLLSISFLPMNAVFADGGMIPVYHGEYKDIYEPSQTSLLVYQNGKEDMYLKVNYEGDTNDFVWIVPTPSLPKASKAPKDVFEELSRVTNTQLKQIPESGSAPTATLGSPQGTGVIVHSQEQVGIYQITVLSASGTNGLFDWLNKNGYKVNEATKKTLDWYVQKEWYFTAVKIQPEDKLAMGVEAFKKFDSSVNDDNFLDKFADYYVQLLKNNDYKKFQNFVNVLETSVPGGDLNGLDSVTTQEDFEKIIKDQQVDTYTSEKWTELKTSIRSALEDYFKSQTPSTVGQYSDYLEPLKISFIANTMVYPMKISEISTKVPANTTDSVKTNEVLLYILSDKQVTAPNFSNEYAGNINTLELGKVDSNPASLLVLKQIVGDQTYFLTKLRRDFSKAEMNDDVYFVDGTTYDPLVDEATMSLASFYKNHTDYAKVKNTVHGSAMADRLKGKIVIKVDDGGKAYYINPITKYSHYLGRPNDAFNVMREQGIGVTNNDLSKIQIGIAGTSGADVDGDGLSNIFEDAIGTDKNKSDSDNDGYNDKIEIENGFDPNGSGKLGVNSDFSTHQKGKILLQVEHMGEAWYINPTDGKRYFLGRPTDAFTIMKTLGLGITNDDFNNL